MVDRPPDLLDAGLISESLDPQVRSRIDRLDVVTEIDSTNTFLLSTRPRAGAMNVCLAEYQRAGRGRRGRNWSAPPGSALCLSASWRFATVPRDVQAFALATGVVVRRTFSRELNICIQLKWPNDLVWDERKLGGILMETVVGPAGDWYVVAGVGINVSMPRHLLREVSDWPRGATDLREAASGKVPQRSPLAAALINALAALFSCYAATGFAPYRDEFVQADFLNGRLVTVNGDASTRTGIARGADGEGALLIETEEGIERVMSGDVSVRTQMKVS